MTLASPHTRKTEINSIQNVRAEPTLPLFSDDMSIYTEAPTGATRKPLELMNEFNEMAEHKIDTQNPFFSYIVATISWKLQFKISINDSIRKHK